MSSITRLVVAGAGCAVVGLLAMRSGGVLAQTQGAPPPAAVTV